MIYQQGTASVTNNSQQVTGSGTKWKKKVKPGHLFTIGDGTKYQVARVTSDTELYLVTPFAGSTQSDISYQVFSDFTEHYNLPYPTQTDVWKMSIMRRTVHTVDRLLDGLHDRILAIEFPGVHPADMEVTPAIDVFAIQQNQGLTAVDMTVTPEIDPVYIQQQQPGGLLVSDATVTPVIDPVVIQVAGSINLTVVDSTLTPVIDSVTFADLVTADSTETADSSTILADGSGGPAAPDVFFVLDQLLTPVIDTVIIQQTGGISLTLQDPVVTPSITTVDLSGGMVTADSNSVTADASNVTADGLLAA